MLKKEKKKSLNYAWALSRHKRLWVTTRHSNFPFQLKELRSRELAKPDKLIYTYQKLKLWIHIVPATRIRECLAKRQKHGVISEKKKMS